MRSKTNDWTNLCSCLARVRRFRFVFLLQQAIHDEITYTLPTLEVDLAPTYHVTNEASNYRRIWIGRDAQQKTAITKMDLFTCVSTHYL